MAFIIHLICCCAMGAMCSLLDISILSWEYWVLLGLLIISRICGLYEGENNKGGK